MKSKSIFLNEFVKINTAFQEITSSNYFFQVLPQILFVNRNRLCFEMSESYMTPDFMWNRS